MNVEHINIGPRAEDVEAVIAVLPQCVAAAAEQVGLAGVQGFFNGYKDAQESMKLAA